MTVPRSEVSASANPMSLADNVPGANLDSLDILIASSVTVHQLLSVMKTQVFNITFFQVLLPKMEDPFNLFTI